MSRRIRWFHWTDEGLDEFGSMPLENVDSELRRFEAEASKLLKSTGADHVVYGVKHYDENSELDEVRFYLLPMDDETFEKDVANKKNIRVYALHRRMMEVE